jgi:pSer/pThr/pTyr-binding forkhead associated (FHA) protein
MPLPPPLSQPHPVRRAEPTVLMEAQPTAPPAGATQMFRHAVLVSEQPIDGRTELPLEPLSTIGRNPRNMIRLTQSAVSSRHAEIRLTAEGYTLKDLGSANGTFVNGQRITEALLKSGDRILIGTYTFEFRRPS